MPGTLAIPKVFDGTTGDQPFADLDLDFSTVAAYVNAREITSDLLVNRPQPGTRGRLYFANDDAGGTLYLDTGAAWVQIAFPVGQTATESLFYALPLWCPTL